MRTKNGHLELTDRDEPDRKTIVIPHHRGIILLNVNRDADQQAEVLLDTEGLDQLAAEILRIREERGY